MNGEKVEEVNFETGRLILRKPVISDAEDIFRNYARDPEVVKYLMWRVHKDISESIDFIKFCISEWDSNGSYAFCIYSREDRQVVYRARRLERFLTQPFFTTTQFTGLEGKMVDIEDTLAGCERILNDDFSDRPESALYMIGAIDEAKESEMIEAPSSPETDEKKVESKEPTP